MKDIAESQSQNSALIKSIKIKAFVFIALWAILQIITLLSFAYKYENAILVVLDIFILIITFISLIVLTLSVQRASKSKHLLKNLLMATIIAPLVFLLCALCVYMLLSNVKINSEIMKTLGGVGVVIFSLLFLSILFVYSYRYMRELAFVTNQKLFMVLVWYAIVIGLLTPFILGTNWNILTLQFALIPSFIMYIIAWVRFKEIRLSQMCVTTTPKIKIETFLIAVIIVLMLVFVVLLLGMLSK